MMERIAEASPRLGIFNQLFPKSADNSYRGHKLVLWCFALVLLLNLGSLDSIFNGYSMAGSGDGIPLARSRPPAHRR